MNTSFNVRPPDTFVFNSADDISSEDVSYAIVSYTLDPLTETFTRQIGDVTFTPEQKDYLATLFEQLAKTNQVINYDVLSDAGNRRFISKLYDDLDKKKENAELEKALAMSTLYQETVSTPVTANQDLDPELEAALKFSLQAQFDQ
jgi:hypothetical protein